MLGSALYFPYIDIQDPVWLRSTLLFWDDMQTIVPSAIENPYRTTDTEICFKEGVLQPVRCDLHFNIIDELGKKVISLGDRHSDIERAIRRIDTPFSQSIRDVGPISWDIEDAFMQVGMHPEKMSPELRHLALTFGLSRMHGQKLPSHLRRLFRDLEMSRIHPEKLPYVLREFFGGGRYVDQDGEWLLVDSRFAAAYMSALAAKLSQQLMLSPLTSESEAHGMSFRFLFDDVVDESPASAEGALLTLTMRGVAVDASVPIEKIIKFKRDRKDQYLEFRSQIDELAEQIEAEETTRPNVLFEKASAIYERKIKRSLRQLKRELDHQSISTTWEGAFTAATVSASSTTALAYFSGLTGPALLGAAAAIGAASISVRGYLAGRKARISNPYSYLHDIKANFGLPDFT